MAANDEITLAVLGTKLDNIGDQLGTHIEHFEKHVDSNEHDFRDHSDQLNELNGWRRYVTGGLAVLSLLFAGLGGAVVIHLIWGAGGSH